MLAHGLAVPIAALIHEVVEEMHSSNPSDLEPKEMLLHALTSESAQTELLLATALQAVVAGRGLLSQKY